MTPMRQGRKKKKKSQQRNGGEPRPEEEQRFTFGLAHVAMDQSAKD